MQKLTNLCRKRRTGFVDEELKDQNALEISRTSENFKVAKIRRNVKCSKHMFELIYTSFATFTKTGENDLVQYFTYNSSLIKRSNNPDRPQQHIQRF